MATVNLAPSSAGFYTEWYSGFSGENWDDVTDGSDATYVSSDSPGARDLFVFEDLASETWIISAVTLYLRWSAGGSADDIVRFFWRDSIGNEAETADYGGIPLAITTQGHTITYPPDGGEWTPSKVNSSQFGYELMSIDVGTFDVRIYEVYLAVTYTVPSGKVSIPSGELSGIGGMGSQHWDPLG